MAETEYNHSMTTFTLQPPPAPVSIGSGHISTGERTLSIRCPDRFFSSSTCTIKDEYSEPLFNFEIPAPLKSYSVRRILKDAASDKTLFVVRHPHSKIHTTAVETESGDQVCLLKDHGDSITTQTAQVHFGECYEAIDIRDADATGTKTLYQVQGRTVAELTLLENYEMNAAMRKTSGIRTAWRLRMAEGLDMALFVALMFARAEITHSFRRN